MKKETKAWNQMPTLLEMVRKTTEESLNRPRWVDLFDKLKSLIYFRAEKGNTYLEIEHNKIISDKFYLSELNKALGKLTEEGFNIEHFKFYSKSRISW